MPVALGSLLMTTTQVDLALRLFGRCSLLLCCLPLRRCAGGSQRPVPKPKPVPTPPPEQIEASIRRGVEFLLKRQNANGSWGSAPAPGPTRSMPPCPAPIRLSGGRDGDVRLGPAGGRRRQRRSRPGRRSRRSLAAGAPAGRPPRVGRHHLQQLVPRLLDRGLARAAAAPPRRQGALPQAPRVDGQQVGHAAAATSASTAAGATTTSTLHTQRPSGSTISFVTATALVALRQAQGRRRGRAAAADRSRAWPPCSASASPTSATTMANT